MDDFLKNDACDQQSKNLNVTYLAKYQDDIVGFFSLISDIIKLKDIECEYDFPYGTCPAIKIGRFAVNEKYNSSIALSELQFLYPKDFMTYSSM